ncbi:hypothetical protein Sjap_014761 [Stephania japonica]|uniref:Uncharacterized protein n=1 Tax=Stephania japonica TaxID=461633 RepID=A0AAP0IHW0_9MAGN
MKENGGFWRLETSSGLLKFWVETAQRAGNSREMRTTAQRTGHSFQCAECRTEANINASQQLRKGTADSSVVCQKLKGDLQAMFTVLPKDMQEILLFNPLMVALLQGSLELTKLPGRPSVAIAANDTTVMGGRSEFSKLGFVTGKMENRSEVFEARSREMEFRSDSMQETDGGLGSEMLGSNHTFGGS